MQHQNLKSTVGKHFAKLNVLIFTFVAILFTINAMPITGISIVAFLALFLAGSSDTRASNPQALIPIPEVKAQINCMANQIHTIRWEFDRLDADLTAAIESLQNCSGLIDNPIAQRRHAGDEFYAETVKDLRAVLERFANHPASDAQEEV